MTVGQEPLGQCLLHFSEEKVVLDSDILDYPYCGAETLSS